MPVFDIHRIFDDPTLDTPTISRFDNNFRKQNALYVIQYFYRICPTSVTVPYLTGQNRTEPYRTEPSLFKNTSTFKSDVFCQTVACNVTFKNTPLHQSLH